MLVSETLDHWENRNDSFRVMRPAFLRTQRTVWRGNSVIDTKLAVCQHDQTVSAVGWSLPLHLIGQFCLAAILKRLPTSGGASRVAGRFPIPYVMPGDLS
jgi:hypothetical protein